MTEAADAVADSARDADPELVEVFRTFETALWAHINAPDSPAGRRRVAEAVAAELSRVQGAVGTELEIVS